MATASPCCMPIRSQVLAVFFHLISIISLDPHGHPVKLASLPLFPR